MNKTIKLQPDFLVIGSGIAGLRAAIELASRGKVLILTKSTPRESNTKYAQGGVAVALSEEDEVSLHLNDTLEAGDGLCNEEAVKILVGDGPRVINQLIEWGIKFDKQGTQLAFTREGAHSRHRVLHSNGDSTGREIMRALLAKASTLKNIEVRPFSFVIDLCCTAGKVEGVEFFDETNKVIQMVQAPQILLATGGLGQVYRETTNPLVASGDGVALAYRAGAVISDLEFIQFHPTALYKKKAPRFLLTEALRGEGGILRNAELDRFVDRYHEEGELATRDVVSRAIISETRRLGSECVYLDMTGLDPERIRKRFPRIYKTCLNCDIDITANLIPVLPAAHYAMGGVHTDTEGRSSLLGLYAAGEVAANGVHGANRLASNSLLEGLVFGARAGLHMGSGSPFVTPRNRVIGKKISTNLESTCRSKEKAESSENKNLRDAPVKRISKEDLEKQTEEIRDLLWQKVGIVRDEKEMEAVVVKLKDLTSPTSNRINRQELEFQNIHLVAKLIVKSALARKESVGTHYRSDFPSKSKKGKPKHSFVSKGSPVRFS